MMKGERDNLVRMWARFVGESSGAVNLAASAFAVVLAVILWAVELSALRDWRPSTVVLGLFAAFAIGYAVPVAWTWRYWRVWRLFAWASVERLRMYPRDRGAGGHPRLDELLGMATDDERSWIEIRSRASELTPRVRREQLGLLEDVMVHGQFDAERYDAAICELTDEGEKDYWLVSRAMIEAFAEYLDGGDFRAPLLRAATGRVQTRMTIGALLRLFGLSFAFLGAGIALNLAIRIIWNA